MFYIFLFISGLAVGSFLNVVIDRLTYNESFFGRSYCDFCRTQLKSYDLFPLFSFFMYKGISRCCGKKLSWYYPIVEISTALLFVLLWTFVPVADIYRFLYLAIGACLIAIFFSDPKYKIIPEGLLMGNRLFAIPFFLMNPLDHLIGGIVIFGIFQFIHSVTKGKAMGYGDVKFALVIGLFQGLRLGALSMYFAFLLGGIMGIVLVIFHKKKPKSMIAFGPFLVIGVVLTIFFEKTLLQIIGQYFYPLR